jgi:DNA-binding SARP family transcriptional activator/tetratricopeptide (TPR) repeat protein
MADAAEIRLLGELTVTRGGRPSALPASKRTRALLGYLAVTGGSHSREQLCDLLWQGPDDPRAALRWSLAKLRTALGPAALVADRERVSLGEVSTDLEAVRALLAGGIAHATADGLVRAAELFRGELLEGLALPDCYGYHEWLVAERESARSERTALVAALVERTSKPEDALRWARELVALDPLSEAAHIRVIRLLSDLGRRREAIAQFETCRRILAQETGNKPSPALLEARMGIVAARSLQPPPPPERSDPAAAPAQPDAAAAPQPALVPLVGRAAELRVVASALERTERGEVPRVLVVLGEPGIGKSRMLAEVAARARAAGGTVLAGGAFEAEMVRPYGPWIDALRAVSASSIPDALRSDLAPLVPQLGGSGSPHDRTSMFDAVVRLLVHLAGASGPLLVLFDDIHWLDEASAGLLHYVARALAGARVLLVCGARGGELSDNAAALRLVRGLSRHQLSETLELGPLEPEATLLLCRSIASGVDLERAVRDSAGNPLLALELTRAIARNPDAVWESLEGLIAERLARLEAPTLDLVSWAAALGKSFDLHTLECVTGASPIDLLTRVGELESRGVVRASADGRRFDFVHDLVRTGAYHRLSAPTRRVVHRRIARALDEMSAADPAMAGEVVHHAELGGDGALVARAAVLAARRCLRIFANAEATRLAELGLGHLGALPAEERLSAQLALLEVLVYAGSSAARPERLRVELTRTVAEAQHSGESEIASTGLHVLSVLQFDEGDLAGAHESTLRSADAAQGVDARARARRLGDSARCLVTLERDVDQAEEMIAEALRLGGPGWGDLLEIRCGVGVFRAFKGELDAALQNLERALELARSSEDGWSQYECLRALVQLELEVGRPTDRCAALLVVASKMGEGSELPTASALAALDALVRGNPKAEDAIESALESLRNLDAKGMSAYVLIFAAEHDVTAGQLDRAERRASEALRAAALVKRQSQAALARAVLGRVALLRGDPAGARRHVEAVQPDLARPTALSARARRAVVALEAALKDVPRPELL